jgi:uncharacterized membrane protein
MNKLEFIDILKQKLSLLPQNELDERINFYSEIIDDYIEDGYNEIDAVSKLGSVDDVVNEILKDTSILKLAKNKFKPKTKLEPWVILLIILSFPIWFTLLVSLLSVVLSLYVSFWSIVISLWAVFGTLIACAVGGIISGIVFLFTNSKMTGLLLISVGLVCSGLAVFCYFGIVTLTKLLLKFGKFVILSIKKLFIRKENKND